jgi:hypothetical protein
MVNYHILYCFTVYSCENANPEATKIEKKKNQFRILCIAGYRDHTIYARSMEFCFYDEYILSWKITDLLKKNET